jgi:hypothetical protein
MPVRLPLFSLAALPLLAACTAEADREQRIRAPAVEVLGEPENCVLVSRIQHTIVHDDYTIDFDMIGNEVFRNTLPNKCPTLGFEESFAYEVSTSQLCDLDHIHVIQSGAAGAGPVCSLGKFVPVRYVEPAG